MEEHEVKTTSRRFFVVAIFSISTFISAFMWISLSAVADIAQSAYNISPLELNMISLVFLIAYLPASLLALFLIESYGMRVNLLVGIGLTALGCILKYVGTLLSVQYAYAIILFGQIIASIAQPLIVNVPARISADWLDKNERDFGTITMSMANSIGQCLGSLIPPLITSSSSDLPRLMLVQAIPAVAAFIFATFILQDHPKHPPSLAALKIRLKRLSLLEEMSDESGNVSAADHRRNVFAQMNTDLMQLITNSNFLFLSIGFSISSGLAWAILTVQNQMLGGCGYDDATIGLSGSLLFGVGVFLAFLFGPFLERTRYYVSTQKILTYSCVLATLYVLAVNKPNGKVNVLISWTILGAIVQPLMPVALEHAAEATYPIPADVSTGLLLTIANVISMVQIFVLTALLELPVSANCTSIYNPASFFIILSVVVGAICTIPMKKDYRRLAVEQKGNQENGEEESSETSLLLVQA
jgi:MFS family permease